MSCKNILKFDQMKLKILEIIFYKPRVEINPKILMLVFFSKECINKNLNNYIITI